MPNKPTFGRYAEIPLDEMTPEQREGYDFIVKERGQVPSPNKIFVQDPDLMKIVVPIGAYFGNNSSLASPEREIATSVINARWLASYSNYAPSHLAPIRREHDLQVAVPALVEAPEGVGGLFEG